MGRKAILMVVDGGIRKSTLAKPQAPRTLGAWFRAADSRAATYRTGTYMFWAQGHWHVFCGSQLAKTFKGKDMQAAAEVYMLAIGARHG